MKRAYRIGLCIALLGSVVAVGAKWTARARAEAPNPPTKMPIADAARLDRDLSHLRELKSAMAPYEKEAGEICTAYKIDPSELGRSVGVNFETGDIQRLKATK